MKISLQQFTDYQRVKRFLIWFYIIGAAGLLIPYTRSFFIVLTPLTLLLSCALLVIHQKNRWSRQHLITLGIIYVAGLLIEIIGVHTGIIFGNYVYGSGLGLQLMDTPLLIGINWAMLVYCSAIIVKTVKAPAIVKIILASLVMVTYDLVLEQVAPFMDLWSWENNKIPLQNYVAWFVISFVFHSLYYPIAKTIENRLALPVLLIQYAFLSVIMFGIKLMP